jgi:peptidoglycan/LPS O-acetylase OafA/YrhL
LWNHTWSLEVEEHFYFGLALLFALLAKFRAGKNPFRLVPLLFAGLALTCLALRLWTWKCSGSFTDKVNFYPTHLRLDALGCGVTVAYWQHTHGAQFMAWARRWRWRLFVVGLLALAPAFAADLKQSPYNYTLGLTQFYLGSACLLVAMLAVELPENFLTRGLAYVGARSYSIYLWHMVWLEWIVPLVSGADKAGRNWPLYAATYLGGALAVGVALAALVELPGLRWRERWFPAR